VTVDGFLPTFTRRLLTPPALKGFTLDRPSSRAGIPERVIIPLQDVPDAPFDIMVKTGDFVRSGQKVGLMGKPPACISAHATTSGKVDHTGPLPHPLGFKAHSVSILPNGEDEQDKLIPLDDMGLSGDREKLFEGFRDMGVPLNYSLLYASGFKISRLLINATEFEPYITSRHQLIKERGQNLMDGLRVLAGACSASRILILIEKEQASLARLLGQATKNIPGLIIKSVARPYPETANGFLARKLFSKNSIFRSPAVPADIMAVDISSLLAVYNAFFSGLPHTEQLITVAGSGVKFPQNVWVKTGTPLTHIITHAGGSPSCLGRVSLGGPLMGIPQHSLEPPLIKRAKGLFAAVAFLFDEHRRSRFYKKTPCIKCGKCVDVCPVSIIPNLVADYVDNEHLEDAERFGVFRCVECGLCEYVCPSRIPLLEILKLGKVMLKGEESLLARTNLETLGW
jgi:electron transport complex protein RnfC